MDRSTGLLHREPLEKWELARRVGPADLFPADLLLSPRSAEAWGRIGTTWYTTDIGTRSWSRQVSLLAIPFLALEEHSLAHFNLDPMLRAATLLADAGMNAIAWNGTSGAWRGLDADYELCEAITRDTEVPATTSTGVVQEVGQMGLHLGRASLPASGTSVGNWRLSRSFALPSSSRALSGTATPTLNHALPRWPRSSRSRHTG